MTNKNILFLAKERDYQVWISGKHVKHTNVNDVLEKEYKHMKNRQSPII